MRGFSFTGHILMRLEERLILNELELVFSEAVEKAAIIVMKVLPDDEYPQYLTTVRVIGFDRAVKKGEAGWSTDPVLKAEQTWSFVDIPEYQNPAMQRKMPTPWVMFIDWIWNVLDKNGLNPRTAGEGKKAKYGKRIKMPRTGPGIKGLPAGYDIQRDIEVSINILGEEAVLNEKFGAILKKAAPLAWFRLTTDGERWYVVTRVEEAGYPLGAEQEMERIRSASLQAVEEYDKEMGRLTSELADEGHDVDKSIVESIVGDYLSKLGFGRPFSFAKLNPEYKKRVVKILRTMTVQDVVDLLESVQEQQLQVLHEYNVDRARVASQLKCDDSLMATFLAMLGKSNSYIKQQVPDCSLSEEDLSRVRVFASTMSDKELPTLSAAKQAVMLELLYLDMMDMYGRLLSSLSESQLKDIWGIMPRSLCEREIRTPSPADPLFWKTLTSNEELDIYGNYADTLSRLRKFYGRLGPEWKSVVNRLSNVALESEEKHEIMSTISAITNAFIKGEKIPPARRNYVDRMLKQWAGSSLADINAAVGAESRVYGLA